MRCIGITTWYHSHKPRRHRHIKHKFRRLNGNMRYATNNARVAQKVLIKKPSKPLEWSQLCQIASERFIKVINWVRDHHHSYLFLKDLAHSSKCRRVNCSPYCNMFRKIRRHIIYAHRPCKMIGIYSLLLRAHINQCNELNCDLQICNQERARIMRVDRVLRKRPTFKG